MPQSHCVARTITPCDKLCIHGNMFNILQQSLALRKSSKILQRYSLWCPITPVFLNKSNKMKKALKNASLSHIVLLCVLVARIFFWTYNMTSSKKKTSQKTLSSMNIHELQAKWLRTRPYPWHNSWYCVDIWYIDVSWYVKQLWKNEFYNYL